MVDYSLAIAARANLQEASATALLPGHIATLTSSLGGSGYAPTLAASGNAAQDTVEPAFGFG
jgi:hypothetical protein